MGNESGEAVGCTQCWPADAEGAWIARRNLRRVAELVDDPHFHVMLLACPNCSGRFVSIFTEFVDWAEGDDAQYWNLIPITEREAEDIVSQGNDINEGTFSQLERTRCYLKHDHPTGKASRFYWSDGTNVRST